jgi:hypothetical protein
MNKDNQLSPGDLAEIIKSVDGISVGKIVQCVQVDGVHSKHGTMWLVSARDELVTEYGAVGIRAHVPQAWLKKILPPGTPEKILEKELERVEK